MPRSANPVSISSPCPRSRSIAMFLRPIRLPTGFQSIFIIVVAIGQRSNSRGFTTVRVNLNVRVKRISLDEGEISIDDGGVNSNTDRLLTRVSSYLLSVVSRCESRADTRPARVSASFESRQKARERPRRDQGGKKVEGGDATEAYDLRRGID